MGLQSFDNHNLDVRAGSKLPHVGQLGGIVNEIAAGGIVIERGKMLLDPPGKNKPALPPDTR